MKKEIIKWRWNADNERKNEVKIGADENRKNKVEMGG
jgi:hypothetical protein